MNGGRNIGSKDFEICRACLLTGCKLFPIMKYNLAKSFKHISGRDVLEKSMLPTSLCAECAQRLVNFEKFRSKVRRAEELMIKILATNNELTTHTVSSIDRIKYGLQSNLVCSRMEPNLCHVHISHEDCESKLNINSSTLDLDLEVKEESCDEMAHNVDATGNELHETSKHNDRCFTEIADISDQTKNPSDSSTDVLPDIKLETEIFAAENKDKHSSNGVYSKDGVVSDLCDGYSSDDSIPLVLKKSKKRLFSKKKSKNSKHSRTKGDIKIKDLSKPKVDRRKKPFLNDLNETLFTIVDLEFDEQIAEIEKRQETANFKNSSHKCMECFKGFLDVNAYDGHMLRHTDQWGDHVCSVCKIHFKKHHALRKHVTAHHTQRFCCNVCPYVTTHRQTARLYERWHKGTKYKCPHCPEEFLKFTTYMGHIRIKHPSDFICQLCGYSFVSEKGINLHKKLKHRLDQSEVPESGPNCELCNVKFVSEEALKRHFSVSSRHCDDGNDSKGCNQPKKSRRRELQNKMGKNNAESEGSNVFFGHNKRIEGPIPCEQCGVQLEDARAYHSHFRRAHPDKNRTNYPTMKAPCMCEHCGRMFQSQALLRDHIHTHSGERSFACDSCDKRFATRQRLVAHSRVHDRPPPTADHKCPHCAKTFTTRSNRQRHMAIHTGLRPFKCEMCAKCFKHSSEKRAHVTYVHLKKPWPRRSRASRGAARAAEHAGAWPVCQAGY